MVLVKLVLQWFYTDFTTGFSHFVMKLQSKNAIFFMMLNILDHGQSSYWTAKLSFLFLTSDQTWADPNYTLGVDFWTKIFYNLKNSGSDLSYLMRSQALF